jgi:hypothetical protein
MMKPDWFFLLLLPFYCHAVPHHPASETTYGTAWVSVSHCRHGDNDGASTYRGTSRIEYAYSIDFSGTRSATPYSVLTL